MRAINIKDMNPDLERLIRLQQLETFVDDARRKLADQPERARTLEARLESAKEALVSAKQKLAENQTDRRAIEKELAVIQGRLSKFKDQLMEVKTNREYQAMQKEIEIAQGEVRALEDRILVRMLEADELAATVKRGESALSSEQKAVAEERVLLDREMASLQQELDNAIAARQALIREIDRHSLAIFEQVARVRKGVAVAEARDGICTICHVRLRPQVFNDIRRNDSIIQCESCQRILYFVRPPGAARDAAAAESDPATA
jgi:predicted  nucleic acid-binding Zn-ribbon protein